MIDYLLLGGFAAAGVYTIYRLVVGFRNSSTPVASSEGAEETPEAIAVDHSPPAGSVTRAPWRARK